jgi:hypothetical protein
VQNSYQIGLKPKEKRRLSANRQTAETTCSFSSRQHLHIVEWDLKTAFFPVSCLAAESQSQRMATAVLHFFPTSRRFLRSQHVRRSRRREFSQVPREPRAGGESSSRRYARSQD